MQRSAWQVAQADLALPERAGVRWRATVSERSLVRSGQRWTLTIVGQVAPLVLAAAAVVWMSPLTVPLAVVLLVHAWAIPSLYAARGAAVLSPKTAAGRGDGARVHADRTDAHARALGLLGDLLDHDARALQRRSGLVLERGTLGVWLLGEAGAVLVAPGGRRVFCYCVRVTDGSLPAGDRIAHLLLALRADERGFATVANLAFCGAPWRLRRRLGRPARLALAAAVAIARKAA